MARPRSTLCEGESLMKHCIGWIGLALISLAACQQQPAAPDPEASQSTAAASETAPASPVPSSSSTVAADASGQTIPAALQGNWGLVPADCTSTRGDNKGLLRITDKNDFRALAFSLGHNTLELARADHSRLVDHEDVLAGQPLAILPPLMFEAGERARGDA